MSDRRCRNGTSSHRARFAIAALALLAVMLTSSASEALHLKSPVITQVTDRPSQQLGGARFTMVSNVMLFHSDADLLGNGNNVPQIFVFDTAKRILKNDRAFYQLTYGDQGSFSPSGSPRATTLAFHSAADLLKNGSVGRQIFMARKVKFKHPLKTQFVQLTKNLGESYDAQLNFSGRYIVFTSTGDLTGQNPPPPAHICIARITASCATANAEATLAPLAAHSQA